jgi:hypothetical protein
VTTEIDKLRGQVERLKDELRQRENATSYEVSVFVSGDWRTALRTPNRIPAITEAQRLLPRG